MTGSLVIDASYAFRMILEGLVQGRLQGQVERWGREGIVLCAPTLWQYEVTSALCKAVHFGVLAADEGRDALTLAQRLGVQLIAPDADQVERAYNWTLRLNRASAYDSFYLALAEVLGCELWTADQRLRNAADLPWVHLAE